MSEFDNVEAKMVGDAIWIGKPEGRMVGDQWIVEIPRKAEPVDETKAKLVMLSCVFAGFILGVMATELVVLVYQCN